MTNKFLDDASKAALIGGVGASSVPIFLQSFIPGGPLGTLIACAIMGLIAFKIIDSAF